MNTYEFKKCVNRYSDSYMFNPSPHSISNSINQTLFKRNDIKDIFNQTDLTTNVPDSNGPINSLRYDKISPNNNDFKL